VSRRGQSGQSLVLAAILMTVLVGFTGLAIDGGEATAQQELVRNAADGASLAAATAQAGNVVTADGLPASDLTLSYLDSGGAATVVPASVATVRAVVAHSSSTFFLGAVGIRNIRVTASADASTAASGGAAGSTPCALCVMKATTTTFATGTSDVVTLSGPIQMNSTAGQAINLGGSTSVTAT